jgi:hypothetical protein
MEDRLEVFRGQIEEMQGRMERTLGQLQGPRGVPMMVKGRSLEVRGKARQTMARARMSAQDISEAFAKHPEQFTPYIGLLAFGVTVASLAIFFPRTFGGFWNWLQARFSDLTRAGMHAAETGTPTGMGPGMGTGYGTGTGTGTSSGMGTYTGGTRP